MTTRSEPMLTAEGLSGLLDTAMEPPGYVVRHRDHAGRPWRVVATVRTHAEAVRFIDGRGDFWISSVADVEPEPGALF